MEVWQSWFDHGDDEFLSGVSTHSAGRQRSTGLHLTPPSLTGTPKLRSAEPSYFILCQRGLKFPTEGSYLIGVVAASRDRVGRRYPLVIWQAVSPQWAEQILAAPARWLTDLAQVMHHHICMPDGSGLAAAVDALWDDHRPGWRDRIQISFRRLADARNPATSEGLRSDGFSGPATMRADWPLPLFRSGSLGSIWLPGADRAIEIDNVSTIRRIVAGL